jgi:CARDB
MTMRHSIPVRAGFGTTVALTVVATMGLAGPPATAAVPHTSTAGTKQSPLPDLVVRSIAKPPSEVQPGTGFRFRVTIKNRGIARASRSGTSFVLSSDRHRNRDDVALARSAPLRVTAALDQGEAWKRSGRLTIPASTPAGVYYLIACADARRQVRERGEDNCRASTRRLAVRPPEPQPPSSPPPPPPRDPPAESATPAPTPTPTATPTPPSSTTPPPPPPPPPPPAATR